MTLTHLIPTLRASIPDPIDSRVWPAGTTATTVDVIVDGVSLLHAAQVGGTPSVVSARVTASAAHSVMVVRVAALAEHLDGEPVAFVDGDPDAAGAVWGQARLIGRVSTVKDRATVVRPAPPYGTSCTRSVARLPRDLREGDLVALPCGVVSADRLTGAVPVSAGGQQLPM